MLETIASFLSRYFKCVPKNFNQPWDVLDVLKELQPLFAAKDPECATVGKADIYGTCEIELQPYVVISGPVFVGQNCRIGPYSFLRGPVVLGDNVKIGPHCEIARSVIMDGSCISHKNIIVDSLIGSNVHLAGFATTCNLPIGREFVRVNYKDKCTQYRGRYGATIENNVSVGIFGALMPGVYLPEGESYPGPCILYGKGKSRKT